MKSGAKIQKRPVIKTELWPHTIANEDDGENITSENINLSKFLSCFTYIVTCCGGVESRGRSALLHAVTTVLEYLQWTDAFEAVACTVSIQCCHFDGFPVKSDSFVCDMTGKNCQ